MGSLFNLYQSQSFQSLIHLATDNTASANFIELEDGLGNGLGVSVNTLGEISASGNIYAANITGSTVNTSSLVTTSSFNAYTQSNDAKWNTLGGISGSWITESETASFARTDVTNTFTADQIINGNLNVSGVISASVIHTIFETASVIFSSGSNQFGDAANDVQTLWGSVRVVNELTASGLRYPTTDGTVEQFLSTNGAGNLSFANVRTLYQNIRNRESVSIVKGTPLFASGSTGDNVDVYIADAGNPLRMPATLIAGDATLAPSATGKAIIFGHIEGVNTTGYPAGTAIYVGVGGGWTAVRPTGSTTPVQPLGIVTREGNNGMGIVLTETPYSLPNIQTGFAWVGNGTNQPVAVATSSFAGTTINTGSFATTGSNTFTGDQTLIDAAGNTVTLTNSSGSLILVAKGFTSSSAHITGSGNQVNIFFKPNNNTADTIISGSGNIITNLPAPTAGFKRFFTLGNLAMSNGSMQISASMAFPVSASGNYFANSNTTLRGPVSSSIWNISNNDMLGGINIGQTAVNHAERAVSGVTFLQNFQNGTFNLIANRSNLETTATFRQSYLGGLNTITAASSSVFYDSNLTQGTLTITNSALRAGAPAANLAQIINCMFIGSGSVIAISGSTTDLNAASDFNKTIISSNILGHQNRFSVERTGPSSSTALVGTTLVGANLIVTGSNSYTTTNSDASTIGTVIVGRFNSIEGNLAGSGETVFAVGTGNSTSNRRTGFHIDSGSNATISGSLAISGTFNINGPATFTGSVAGNVVSASITSNTASIDFNRGNYFELTSSVTPLHLNITNIQPGETSTLIISASASSSITFSPNVSQPSGSAYSGSLGSIDILSLVAFNTSKVNIVSTKNMI